MRVLVNAHVAQILFGCARKVDFIEDLVGWIPIANERENEAAQAQHAHHHVVDRAHDREPFERIEEPARPKSRHRRAAYRDLTRSLRGRRAGLRAGRRAQENIPQHEEHADGDERVKRRERAPEVLRIDAGRVIGDHAEILQRIHHVCEEHHGKRKRAPQVPARDRNAGRAEQHRVEAVAFVHSRGEDEKREQRERARLHQSRCGTVLDIAPDQQRGRGHDQPDAPHVLRQMHAEPDEGGVLLPERAADRPQIERVDGVIVVDARTEFVAGQQPA